MNGGFVEKRERKRKKQKGGGGRAADEDALPFLGIYLENWVMQRCRSTQQSVRPLFNLPFCSRHFTHKSGIKCVVYAGGLIFSCCGGNAEAP